MVGVLHQAKIEKIILKEDNINIFTDSEMTISLPIHSFRDPAYLDKIRKGDKIIYFDDSKGNITEVFFPAYL
jgi:Cu/Ag efflux protein CusF